MSLRTTFTILAVILLVGHTVSAPGGKPGSRVSDKPAVKAERPASIKGAKKGGGKGGNNPAAQQTTDNNRHSRPLDILPYHYTVSIVPDLDNSTFFGEVTIDFEAERATQEIVLHAANLRIDYDKLVLTERRCIPPILETTSAAPSPTPEYVSTARPTPVSIPMTASETSAPGDVISQEQSSSVTDKVEIQMSSVAPPIAEANITEVPPATTIGEAPAMAGEVPGMQEQSPAPVKEGAPPSPMEEAPAAPMEEAPAAPMEEAPAAPMEEAPAAPMEEVPAAPMEEAPAAPMEEAPAAPMEEAPAAPMEEAPAAPMEEGPAAPMEEAPAAPMEEAPAAPMEEAPAAPMEEAPAVLVEEAPAALVEEAPPALMEEAPAAPMEESPAAPIEEATASPLGEAPAMAGDDPAMQEQSPTLAMEEASKPPMSEAPVQLMEEAPAGQVPAVGSTPVDIEKTPSVPEEAPASIHTPEEASAMMDEVISMPEEVSQDEEVPVVADEKAVTSSSNVEASIPQEPTTTVGEQPTETTTVKDTFNLAGEALKILEVLNRSDIPPFIKANLTEDDEIANLSDDIIVEQPVDKIDYIDKLETRTDDLAIEDCQKIEVIQPPPENFVTPPPAEEEESVEETTAGMFNSIRNAIEQIVQTTLAPLLVEEQSATEEKTTTTTLEETTVSAKIPDDESDVLRTIDEKSGGGNSVVETATDGQPEMVDITTNKKSETDITDDKSETEITTDKKSETEIITDVKSELEMSTDGKSSLEMTTDGIIEFITDGKPEMMFTTEGKPVETTTEWKADTTVATSAKSEVEITTDGKSDIKITTEEKPDIVSTTFRTEYVETEPLQREEPSGIPLSETTTAVPEKTTFVSTTEGVSDIHETTDMLTDPPVNIGTEWSIDSSESVTTEDIAYAASTTERGTTEYLPTTTEGRKSRKRRAAPKRKKRPSTNRFKLKQSLKLPTCTSEDMYEVRVDKALIPIKRKTELESSYIGIEFAKDKIRQGDHDALVLPTKTELKAGKRYRLTLSFSGKMSRRPVGLYRSDYVVEEGGRKKAKSVATTVFEPIHARRVFPCVDDPRYRARFSMRIAHPPNLSAYSNMPASTTSDDVDSTSSSGIPSGWLWDRFETSPPMPTYLVAFFVGALARKSRTAAGQPGQNNLMVRVLARRERLRDASFALNLAPKVMMEMGQWLNKPTSLSKLDLLALPGPGPDAVENWGLVSFQERYLLTQPGLLSRFSVASVVSHELAHDWFGNLVTPHHWKYAWLSEGLATFSSAKILNKIQPTWDVEDLATVSAYITAMSSDDDDAIPMQPKKVNNNNYRSVFSPSSYYKGYMTMRMLKGIIGDELLTESLRRYVHQNAFGWAKTSRLWSAVNETIREKSVALDLPRPLPKLMASWIEEPGYPLVTITRNYSTGDVFVQQVRHTAARSEVESNTTWWIPLRAWTAKTTGATLQWIPPSSKRKAVRLSSPIPIGADQWLMANAEFSAPMRVQYDLKNWDLLAAALPNGNLPRGAGAQLSVDALALASNGQLPFSTALKVVSAALGSRTGDAHLTWTAASPVLRRIDRELRGTKASRPYRQWLHRLITPLDTWISFEARNDTLPDAVLARHVTTAACSLAMPLCLTTGRSQFRTWMASNTPEPRVPIELRGALYCAAVRDGSSDTVWRYLWSKIATVSSDEKIRILKALGCTRDPELAKRLLTLAADAKSPVYRKQLPTIFRSIAMHDSGPGIVLSFLAENIQKFGNDTKTVGNLISEVAPAVNSKKDMKKLQGLLPQVTSRATMVKVSADATAAMERSQRLSQGIFAYFNKSKRT